MNRRHLPKREMPPDFLQLQNKKHCLHTDQSDCIVEERTTKKREKSVYLSLLFREYARTLVQMNSVDVAEI